MGTSWSRRLAAACLLTTVAGAGSARAQDITLGRLTKVTDKSPFAGCTIDRPQLQPGFLFRNTEIEPFVEVDPTDPSNLIAVHQQDRWSDGASRGGVAAYSSDGGRNWSPSVPGGVSLCTGGTYVRASDPWVTFSPDGSAYFMHLVTDLSPPSGGEGPNGMIVNKSTNAGRTWGRAITLIRDTDPALFNDKNSITADPNDSRYVYAVWDRLQDFDLAVGNPVGTPTRAPAAATRAAVAAGTGDGVVVARERMRRYREAAAARATNASAATLAEEPTVFLKGPTLFARTTDGGASWEPARIIYDPGINAQTINNIVAVLPSGRVLNFFTELKGFTGIGRIGFVGSDDQGATFDDRPTYVDNIIPTNPGTITPDGTFFVRDGSILFDVAVDAANGNIYLVWQDARFRRVEEIVFSQSTDGGATWSRPVRINQTPTNREIVLRQQAFIPAVAVAGDGTVVVTHYDFRNDPNGAFEGADYWAVLCRAGADCARRSSWGDEQRLTDETFDYFNAPFANGLFLGDYMGLTASGRSVWSVFGIATSLDRTNLFSRRIDLPAALAAR